MNSFLNKMEEKFNNHNSNPKSYFDFNDNHAIRSSIKTSKSNIYYHFGCDKLVHIVLNNGKLCEKLGGKLTCEVSLSFYDKTFDFI